MTLYVQNSISQHQTLVPLSLPITAPPGVSLTFKPQELLECARSRPKFLANFNPTGLDKKLN
jgi:hypothetical protein